MEIKELQKKLVLVAEDYGTEHDVVMDKDYLLPKIFEEAGELAQAMLIYDNKCRTGKRLPKEKAHRLLEQEIADTVGFLFVLADRMNIDLEKGLEDKWLIRLKKN